MFDPLASPIIIVATFVLGGALAIVAAIDDARTRLLRNAYTGPLAAIAFAGFGLGALLDGESFPLGDILAGAAVFAGPWLVVYAISPSSIGFGDVKLSAGLGLYLGWMGIDTALVAFFVAGLLGIIGAIVAAAIGRKTEPLPFGPALVGGALLATAGHVLVNTGH